MGISARQLGWSHHLNAQQCNWLLYLQGILDGTPGNWSLTELGKKFYQVNSSDVGFGGIPNGNPANNTIIYSEEIEDVLDFSQEAINSAISKYKEYKNAVKVAKEVEEIPLGEIVHEVSSVEKVIAFISEHKKGIIITGSGIAIAGCGIYVYQKREEIKKWINSKLPKDKQL